MPWYRRRRKPANPISLYLAGVHGYAFGTALAEAEPMELIEIFAADSDT